MLVLRCFELPLLLSLMLPLFSFWMELSVLFLFCRFLCFGVVAPIFRSVVDLSHHPRGGAMPHIYGLAPAIIIAFSKIYTIHLAPRENRIVECRMELENSFESLRPSAPEERFAVISTTRAGRLLLGISLNTIAPLPGCSSYVVGCRSPSNLRRRKQLLHKHKWPHILTQHRIR